MGIMVHTFILSTGKAGYEDLIGYAGLPDGVQRQPGIKQINVVSSKQTTKATFFSH